jgi:hypothetical protein
MQAVSEPGQYESGNTLRRQTLALEALRERIRLNLRLD